MLETQEYYCKEKYGIAAQSDISGGVAKRKKENN